MTKLYLLGVRKGPNVDCIDTDRIGHLIDDSTPEEIYREEERLRKLAQAAQVEWLKDRDNMDKKAAYGKVLREWANWTGNDDAKAFAYSLIHGLPLPGEGQS